MSNFERAMNAFTGLDRERPPCNSALPMAFMQPCARVPAAFSDYHESTFVKICRTCMWERAFSRASCRSREPRHSRKDGNPDSCAARGFPGFPPLYESPSVIPAKAGIQVVFLDFGFRRNDDERPLRTFMVRCAPRVMAVRGNDVEIVSVYVCRRLSRISKFEESIPCRKR
jgi:hypothetical protein